MTTSSTPSRYKYLKKGLVIFVIGWLVNTIFVVFHIRGILRELSRATVLVGIFLILFGGVYAFFSRK